MTLVRISPDDLIGPKAYFTEWASDYTTGNLEAENRRATRRLKALLLTKTTIVFTATHLDSSIAKQILRKNPILLDKGIMKPALRDERGSIEEVTDDPEMRAFIRDRKITSVSWQLSKGESWFKERLCQELLDPNSVICASIRRTSPSFNPRPLVDEITITENPIQEIVKHHAELLDDRGKHALSHFRELLYHMSGARAVRCESFFPQENLLDYDFFDKDRTRLSDDIVFAKIFVEHAMKTLNRRSFPIEVLDELEISEVLLLREIIEDTGFMEEYDKLMACAIRAATNKEPRETVFHLEQLEKCRSRLFEDFTLAFEQELAKYMALKRRSASSSLISPATSVALGVGGFALPGAGPLITSLLSLAKDGGSFGEALASFINSFNIFTERNEITESKSREDAKLKVLRKAIKKRHNGNSLLDIADLYTTLISEGYKQ